MNLQLRLEVTVSVGPAMKVEVLIITPVVNSNTVERGNTENQIGIHRTKEVTVQGAVEVLQVLVQVIVTQDFQTVVQVLIQVVVDHQEIQNHGRLRVVLRFQNPSPS